MAILPSVERGYLPYALFVTSLMALTHSVVTYLRPIPSQIQFAGPSAPPPNTLTAHIYGVKNVYSGLIRLYAAYSIRNRDLYTLALATYLGVFGLYGAELWIWRTVRMRETLSSFIISGTMICWMLLEKSWYVV
ncbi:hypothetical protein UA08_04927 [Talaromyces atroroseus]|uniref:Ergosterol biosynthetic protein 28 n=1 Tax=Talaromyces atroroseus TaxID=1441469 RepID=A0A225AF60_TALAT|nr:hypothetical protein UA08_04927 [Talaromyces atroroseus]OKL59942.1 hypothetical protein UA08_04927 [Talaromyces atroroseus]